MRMINRVLGLAVALLLAIHAPGAYADGASAGDPSSAVAAGTSGDDWFDSAKQRNWRVDDKISPGMYQILSQAMLDFGSYRPTGGPCSAAAANAAWQSLADAANAGPVEAFLDAIKGALSGIKDVATFGADPSAAADLLAPGALMDAWIQKVRESGQDALQTAVKEKLEEIWKGRPVEVLRRQSSRGGCTTNLVAIWDRATSTYEITIYGNCNCNPVPLWGSDRTFRLKTFAVRLSGRVTPSLRHGDMVLNVGFARATVMQNCNCAAPGTPPPPTPPPHAGGANTPLQDHGISGPNGQGSIDWQKLRTNCPACQPIVDRIKAAQTERDRLEPQFRDLQGHYEAAVTRKDTEAIVTYREAIDNLRKRDAALIAVQRKLFDELLACERAQCPLGGQAPCTPLSPGGGSQATPPPSGGTVTPPAGGEARNCPACKAIQDRIAAKQAELDTLMPQLNDVRRQIRYAEGTGNDAQAAAYKTREAELSTKEASLNSELARARAELEACIKAHCPPAGCGAAETPPSAPPVEDPARRHARLQSIDRLRNGQAAASGTEVAAAYGGNRDLSDEARGEAAARAGEALRNSRRPMPNMPVSPEHPATPATDNPAAPTDQPVPPVTVPVTAPQPGMVPGHVDVPAGPATAPPPPAEPVSLAGTWLLQDTSSGVSRVTIREQGNSTILSGMGPDILLQQAGNAWIGEGAVLFGQGGHTIRLVLQGNTIALSARNSSGGSFSTVMHK